MSDKMTPQEYFEKYNDDDTSVTDLMDGYAGYVLAEKTSKNKRLAVGEAHAICSDCGSKLYSFHGSEDVGRRCPYNNGECKAN